MSKLNSFFCLLLAISLGVVACKDKNVTPQVIDSGITYALKTTGTDETEFLLTQKDLMQGELSAVNSGVEQTGWRFYYPAGKTLFASGYSDDNQCAAFAIDENGKLAQKGEFIFDNALEMFGSADNGETLLAMEIPRAGFQNRRLYFIDVNTVGVKKIVGTKIYESIADSLVAWPTALKVRGNKLFIPFHKLDVHGNFSTPQPDNAFIAVYSYPNVGTSPEKIITDSRTCNIGINGSTTGLIETDNGDLYSLSSGAIMAGFSTLSSKPSGILRINSGATDFDPNYFFDVEAATSGGKLFWFDYVGNNKAIARILTADNTAAPWGAFGRDIFNQKLVILDLENKTVTDVANVPLHAKRYTSPVLVEEGKVYVSIETATDAYVYQVDIASAVGTKGAKIVGKTIKGFYKLH